MVIFVRYPSLQRATTSFALTFCLACVFPIPYAGATASDRGQTANDPLTEPADQQAVAPTDKPSGGKTSHKKKKLDSGSAKKAKTSKPPKHPEVSFGDALTLDVTGRLEGDLRSATPAMGLESPEPQWQDRRLGVKGTAFNRLNFELTRELGDDFESSNGLSQKGAWRDAYVSGGLSKALNIQAGHFKLPFGYEELTGETDLDFVYRSLAARVLSPGRDVGIMTYGRLSDRRVEYQIGYFTRDGDNGRTSQTEGGRDAFASRVVLTPFASSRTNPIGNLRIGMAISTSQVDRRFGLRGRTVLGDGVFFDRTFVNGRRERIGAEASWATGPVSLSSEYIRDADQRKGMGFAGDDLPSVRAYAWYVAGTWALTGERKKGRLEPRHDLPGGGIGAIELVARLETLRFDNAEYPGADFGFPGSSLASNADRVTTVGLNWYLNHYVKIQGDLIMESIADPPRSPTPATDGRFTSAVLRFQFRL